MNTLYNVAQILKIYELQNIIQGNWTRGKINIFNESEGEIIA